MKAVRTDMLTFSRPIFSFCTTIIESGLDIPRVNTILIEDSQRFGLSQLYQLRGRVGVLEFKLMLGCLPKQRMLTEYGAAAHRRSKFTQLGSGYQLATRDMEIRGVGNLLGAEQSGQMEVALTFTWKC